ncbi:hypothetical protein ABPG74_011797 [Tetrahymena malaccensis]
MKIPEKYYKNQPRNDLKQIDDILKLKEDSEFLKALKSLKKNTDLMNHNSLFQIAGLLDRCDSILAKNNDLQNKKIIDELINTQILKFLEQSFEYNNFFRLFCSLEYVIFILDNTDTFKNIQLCIRICQSLVRFSDESNIGYQMVPQKFIYKEKLLDYVKYACHHVNILNGKGIKTQQKKDNTTVSQTGFQLSEIYYDDPRIELVKNRKDVQSGFKESALRKSSVQGRILKLSTDLTAELNLHSNNPLDVMEQDQVNQTISENFFTQSHLNSIYFSTYSGEQPYNFNEQQENTDNTNTSAQLFDQQPLQKSQIEQTQGRESDKNEIKNIELSIKTLDFENKNCVEIAQDLIKQNSLKIDINTSEFARIRVALMYLKHRNNLNERNQMIHYFINSFKILIKNKNSEQLNAFNSNELLEQLVSILYLKSCPKIHAKIIRFIRYYFKSYIIQNFEFFRQILNGIASLKLDESGEKIVFDQDQHEEYILPIETAVNQDFQKKFISMIGEKYESAQNINYQSQIAESIIKITSNTSDTISNNQSQEVGKKIKLIYSFQVVSKARQTLVNLIKNEQVNRQFQIFEKYILPQLLNHLTYCKIAESLQYFDAKQGQWKNITNQEYYSTLSIYLNCINNIFRSSQNTRGNQTLSRKILQTNVFETLIDTLNYFQNLDFFINSLVFVYRLINEQPQLMNSLVQKGLIKLQVDILEREEIPQDISQIKSIIQYMIISSITEEGKLIVNNSKIMSKIFNIFTQKKYVECLTAASVQSDPNNLNPLLQIAEYIARNVRNLEQNAQNEKPVIIDLIIKTFEKLIKQKDKFLDNFQKHMNKQPYDTNELEFSIQEYPQFSFLIDNFCKFYQALCQKDQYFIKHSEHYQIYSLFLQLVKFPVLDMVDTYSKKGLLGYMINVGQFMGPKSIMEVHAILKKEFSMIQKMLGCESGSFQGVKDLQSVISNELFYKTSTLDHQKVFENPDPELVLPVQLFNSLNFVEGLIKIIYISIRQKPDSKIEPEDFIKTVNQMQQLYVILTNQQNNELMYNLQKKYESTLNLTDKTKIATEESECIDLYNQTQGMDYLNNSGNIYSTMRNLFKLLLQGKTNIIKANTQQEVYARAIQKIIQNINHLDETEINDLNKLAELNVNFGHIILFLDVYLEDAKKKGMFQQEYVLDLNLFAQLYELKILDKLIDHIKMAIKALSSYRSKENVSNLHDKLINSTMTSLTEKLIYIINNIIITHIDISQDVYINSNKLSDLGIENILNGINYFFIEQFESIISECLVPLQQESTFISLVEVLFQKIVKVFNLVGKNAPLIIDIQQSLLEKKKLEEEERKKKFNADLKQLEDMGFPRRRAAEALRRCNNNIDEAIDSLASQRFGFDGNQEQGEEDSELDSFQNIGRMARGFSTNAVQEAQKKSLDLESSDHSQLTSLLESNKQNQNEQKIKTKNLQCLKNKIQEFRENISHLLLSNILKFDKSELLVCDIILKYLCDKGNEEVKDKNISQQPLLSIPDNKVAPSTSNYEVVQIILWNFRYLANQLNDSKNSIKISNKVLPADYKPKIILNIDQKSGQSPIVYISYLSRILLILTKIGQKSLKQVIYKNSLGNEIFKFCGEVTEKKIQNENLSLQDQQVIQLFFLRSIVYAHNMVENAKIVNISATVSKKNDQSISSLQANSNKDDSMLSKNSKKKSKKEKQKGDIFEELIKFLQKILDISVKLNENKKVAVLNNKTVQGIITILTQLLQRDWKHLSKEIYDSQILNYILKLKNIGSLDGVLEKLCHLYTLALNDEEVETVSIEAQIKQFFLYHKHSSQAQASSQNKSNKTSEDSNVQILKESNLSQNKEDAIRIPLDIFLQKFASFSQVSCFKNIYNRICTTKKLGGKEYTELNKDIDIYKCQIPVSTNQQTSTNTQKKKSNTNSQNSSIMSSTQIIPSSLLLNPSKMDYTSNFGLKNQQTSNFLNLLLETFISKVTQKISNHKNLNKQKSKLSESPINDDKKQLEKQENEADLQNSQKEESNQTKKEDLQEIDEGVLLYLIHYIIKKFPVLTPVVCKFKIAKIVQKALQSEEECNNLLLTPWQSKGQTNQVQCQNLNQLNFVHFLTRVVMKYFQNFSRDLLLELCMDSFIMRSSHETYASEIRKQVYLDIFTFLDQPNILESPQSVHNLITYSQLHCVLLNLKQFKNAVAFNQANSSLNITSNTDLMSYKQLNIQQLNFIKVYNNILSALKVKQYYQYENIIPFIYHPLSILNRYAFQNILIKDKKNLSADAKYIYQTVSAQFIPIKFGNHLLTSSFASEWQKILQLSDTLNGNQYDQQIYEQHLGYNQIDPLDERQQLIGRFGDFIEIDEDPGELELQMDNPEFQIQEEEEHILRRNELQDQEQIEQEDEEDEEAFQQADIQPRINQFDNQMLILENSLSQDPNHYILEPDIEDADEQEDEEQKQDDLFQESEEGMSELEVQGHRINQQLYEQNVQVGGENEDQEVAVLEQEEDIHEENDDEDEEDEEQDIEDLDDEGDYDQIFEENKTNTQNSSIRNSNQSSEAQVVEKDIKKYLRFDEKTLFCQHQINFALLDLLKKLIKQKLLGKDMSTFYDLYQHLESRYNSYFQKSAEDWKNIDYNYQNLNKQQKARPQRADEANYLEQYQGLINDLIQRDPSDSNLRELIRQLEDGRRSIFNNHNIGQLDAMDNGQQDIQNIFQPLWGRIQNYNNLLQNQLNIRRNVNEAAQTNEQQEREYNQMMRNMRDILISDAVEDVLPNPQGQEQIVAQQESNAENANQSINNQTNNNESNNQVGELIANSLESPNLSPSQLDSSPVRYQQINQVDVQEAQEQNIQVQNQQQQQESQAAQVDQNLEDLLNQAIVQSMQQNLQQQTQQQNTQGINLQMTDFSSILSNISSISNTNNQQPQQQQQQNQQQSASVEIVNQINSQQQQQQQQQHQQQPSQQESQLSEIILRELQNSFQMISQQGGNNNNNNQEQQQGTQNINLQQTNFNSLLTNLQNVIGLTQQQQQQQNTQQQQQEQGVAEIAQQQQQQEQVQIEQEELQQNQNQDQDEIPDFLQRSLALLQQFNMDLGFFERNSIDPIIFDSLPDDIKLETIYTYQPTEQAYQEQLLQQQRQQQAQQNSQPGNNNNNQQANQQTQQQQQAQQQQQLQQPQAEEMDAATFLASLPPHLRDEILLTSTQEFLQQIPQEMRYHAIMLQQRGAAYDNQEAELNQLRKREQKKALEQQRKKEELKQKFLKMKERRDQIVEDATIAPLLSEIADEEVMERVIELLYVGSESFINYPFNLLTSLQENPYSEYKILDAMMFILRNPSILILQNQQKQQSKESSQNVKVFPPNEIIQRNKEPVTSSKEVYQQIAQKILFLFCKITEKNILFFIDKEKAESSFDSIKSISELKDIALPQSQNSGSSKIRKMPFQDLTQLLTSKVIFENTVLLELLIKLLHNISKKYYTYYFTQPTLSDQSNESKETQAFDNLKLKSCTSTDEERKQLKNQAIKSICQVLSSDHLSKSSIKKISDIINYMCIDELNLAEFIAELKSIIMVFAEEINLILDENLPPLRVNSKDQKPLKNIQESVQGVSKVQKMFSIIKELFEKSQAKEVDQKQKEPEEEEESKEQGNSSKKDQDQNQDKETTLQKFNKEQNIKLNNIREKIQLEFNQLAQDKQLQNLWINLAELFSLVGENNEQAKTQQIVQTLQPLLESFLIIQFNMQNKQTLDPISQQLPSIPNISPQSSRYKQQLQPSEEFQISHLHFKDVRERFMGSHHLFYFVCEKSKVIINILIRAKLTEIVRRQNQEIQHRNSRGIEDATILKEPVGLVFKYIPRIIDFENKKLFFQLEINKIRASSPSSQISLTIRRKEVLVDSFYTINQMKPQDLRQRLRIQFEGEEGIDAGGLTREWFIILSKEIFNPGYCLFLPSQSGNTFQPNPNSYINSQDKQYFEFVGRIVGKALFDGYMLDAYFTRSFYKHILGQEITYHDIQDQDNEFYKNMKWIVENDVTSLDLTFVYESDQFGKLQEIELKPNGKNIPVTNENKQEYVQLICKHRMAIRIEYQINFFLKGFHDIIPKDIISVFDSHELELMISGLPDIDIADLKENTEYHNYSQTDKIIQWFWEIMSTYDRTQKAAFIQFVTGTSKVPLEGFSQLRGISGYQKFQIHKAYNTEKLPTTHTCFNQLDLPEYPTKEILIEKLNYAIQEGKEGFGFA